MCCPPSGQSGHWQAGDGAGVSLGEPYLAKPENKRISPGCVPSWYSNLCLIFNLWHFVYIRQITLQSETSENFTGPYFTSLCGSMMTVTLLPVTWDSTCRECMACFLTVELGEVTSRTRSCVTMWNDLSWAASSSSVFSSSFRGVAQRTSNCSKVVLAMATAPFDTCVKTNALPSTVKSEQQLVLQLFVIKSTLCTNLLSPLLWGPSWRRAVPLERWADFVEPRLESVSPLRTWWTQHHQAWNTKLARSSRHTDVPQCRRTMAADTPGDVDETRRLSDVLKP